MLCRPKCKRLRNKRPKFESALANTFSNLDLGEEGGTHFEFSPPTTKLSLRRQGCMNMVPSTLKDLTFNVGH